MGVQSGHWARPSHIAGGLFPASIMLTVVCGGSGEPAPFPWGKDKVDHEDGGGSGRLGEEDVPSATFDGVIDRPQWLEPLLRSPWGP